MPEGRPAALVVVLLLVVGAGTLIGGKDNAMADLTDTAFGAVAELSPTGQRQHGNGTAVLRPTERRDEGIGKGAVVRDVVPHTTLDVAVDRAR